MKRLALLTLVATAAAGLHAQTYYDSARVRRAEPQYESISVPRNECSSQWVTEARPVDRGTQYGGAVVGGVAGAIVGNQVGKGHGREAATAVGAVVGALAGDRMANANRPAEYEQVQREVQTCRTVNDVQSRVTGYKVDYEYRGQYFSTMLPENPGPMLKVRVSVEPVGR